MLTKHFAVWRKCNEDGYTFYIVFAVTLFGRVFEMDYWPAGVPSVVYGEDE
jgi:hypothetical protein